MKLVNILLELTAADEAHRQGLTAAPFGRWANRQGKIVARTVGNKLVPVKAGDDAAQNPDLAPTGTSAVAAGKAPSNALDATSVAKANGDLARDKEAGEETQSGPEGEMAPGEELPTVPKNVYRSTMDGFGQPTTHEEVKKRLEDKNGFLDEMVIGEEVYWATHEELRDFIEGESEEEFGLRKTKTLEDAQRQRTEWRDRFSPKIKHLLAAVQNQWQGEAPFKRNQGERDKINNFINLVCKADPPVVANTTLPIERGMRIPADHAKEFMKAFRIGQEIDMPPSGFSASGKVARDYATTSDNIDPDRLGVLIRLSPNPQGQINGLHLTGYKGEDIAEMDPELAHEIRQDAFFYQGELEIIRPSGPKARCTSVKKMVIPGKQVLYVIDLEEHGYENMKKPVTEDMKQWSKTDNTRFVQFMNTPVRQPLTLEEDLQKHVRLTIITESTTSDQAHDLELLYKGHGFWMNKKGETVAQTLDGNLVKLQTPVPAGVSPNSSQPEESPSIESPSEEEPEPTQQPVQSEQYHAEQNEILSWYPEAAKTEAKTAVTQFGADGDSITELNGIPFTPYQPPPSWNGITGQNPALEDGMPPLPPGKKAAGVVIVEPDGKIWLVEPTNHFGGYDFTFPKGTVDPSEPLQQAAIRETFEETGLKVKITGVVGDIKKTTSTARFFFAEREAGTPQDAGWESQSVRLVTPDMAKKMLNHSVDHPILDALEKFKQQPAPETETNQADDPSAKDGYNLPPDVVFGKKLSVGHLGGTTGGIEVYEGTDGIKRVIKKYFDPSKSSCEKLAGHIYQDLGISAPNTWTVDVAGKSAFASEWVDGTRLDDVDVDQAMAIKVLEGFAADVLTANWDSIGLEDDNIMVQPDGTPCRIDNGGVFMFRSMNTSGRKKDEFLFDVSELYNLPKMNDQFKRMFHRAGVGDDSANLGPVLKNGINKIVQYRMSLGDAGWRGYVEKTAPEMDAKDKDTAAKMLEVRTQLLQQYSQKNL